MCCKENQTQDPEKLKTVSVHIAYHVKKEINLNLMKIEAINL